MASTDCATKVGSRSTCAGEFAERLSPHHQNTDEAFRAEQRNGQYCSISGSHKISSTGDGSATFRSGLCTGARSAAPSAIVLPLRATPWRLSSAISSSLRPKRAVGHTQYFVFLQRPRGVADVV